MGTCWRAESGCTTNADCETVEGCVGGNCYCKLNADGYETPAGGTCEPKGDGIPSNEVKDVNNNVIFTTAQFLVGPNTINWWSARNWCWAHGRKMVSLSSFKTYPVWCSFPCAEDDELGCDYTAVYDGTSATESKVCKPLGSNEIMNINDPYYGNLLSYLRQAIGTDWYWNSNDFGLDQAFGTTLMDGDVDCAWRGGEQEFTNTICE